MYGRGVHPPSFMTATEKTCPSGAAVALLLREQARQLHTQTQRGSWNQSAFKFERELIKSIRAQLEAAACVVEAGLVPMEAMDAHEVRKWRAANPELAEKTGY